MIQFTKRTAWSVAFAAMAGLFASCGGGDAQSTASTSEDEPAATSTSSTTSSPDTTLASPRLSSTTDPPPAITEAPTTSTTSAPVELRVERFDLGLDEPVEVSAVASSAMVHVAVGASGGLGLSKAAVLYSVDGVTWNRVTHSDGLFGEGFGGTKAAIEDVIFTGEQFVAAGWRSGDNQNDAAVWTSIDGIVWTAVANDGPLDGARISALVLADDTIVAIGYDGNEFRADAGAWLSVDGVEWERVDSATAFPGSSGRAQFSDLAWSGDRLVAAGGEIWTSSDGRVWEQVADRKTDFGKAWAIRTVEYSTAAGFIAGGFAGDKVDSYNEAIWRSDDGVEWDLLPSPSAVDGTFNKRQIRDIADTPIGFVATGVQIIAGGTPGQIWTSPDGDSWTRFSGDNKFLNDPAFMTAVVPTADGASILGIESTWVLGLAADGTSGTTASTTAVNAETAAELVADFPETVDDFTLRWNERLDTLGEGDPTDNLVKLLDLLRIGEWSESTLDDGGRVSVAEFVEGGFGFSILRSDSDAPISLIRLTTNPSAMENSEFNSQIFPIVRQMFAELVYGSGGFMVIDQIIAAQTASTLPIEVDGVSWDAAGGVALEASANVD